MDRNVVIATILIGLIMMVWLWWLAPPPPAPVAEDARPADTVLAVPSEPEPVEAPDVAETAPVDTALAGAVEGTERFITVDSDLYTAVFSTRGATLRSLELKEYQMFDQQTPVQMVAESQTGALGLAFTTPSNHNVDSRTLYFDTAYEADTLYVREQGAGISFLTQLGGGTIRKTYSFEPGEYEIGLQIEQVDAEAFSTRDGYEIVWHGGVPFSEDDPEDDARYSGAFARSGGEVESVALDGEAEQEKHLSGSVTWLTVKNKYFAAILIPSGETRGAEIGGARVTDNAGSVVWEDYTARLLMPNAEGEVDQFRLYVGPMEFFRITDYRLGLYDVVDYGWDFFEWMVRPLAQYIFIPVFTFLSNFIPNYGLVIIVFSILIKLVLHPLTKSSFHNMARMRELQPQLQAVKEKFGDDPQKQQAAMMKVYKETGVNPIGGCLPMLLQWPVIIALWQFLPQSLEIRQQGFLWADDLSAPDAILHLPFEIPFYGSFVAGFTLLMGISMIVQMKLQSAPATNPQAKMMIYVFPVIIFMFFNRLASGLSLYYLCYNVLTALQQKLVNRSIEKQKNEKDGAVNGRAGKEEVKRLSGRRPEKVRGKGASPRRARSRR